MLTLAQTIGLLQRFMQQRNAAEWLDNDRRYSPVLPFMQIDKEVFYFEEDVARFVQKLGAQAALLFQ